MLSRIRWRELASALVWGFAMAVATFFVSLPSAALVAFWGGFAGYLGGCWLASTRLRVGAVLAGLLILGLMFWLVSGMLSDTYALASLLGAELSFTLSQWSQWGGQALLVSAGLRFLGGRQPALISAEILTVTLLLASPLAAHRQGFINRPYFLVDPLWSRNLDPIPILFALGAVAAVLLVILQNGRRTRRASWFDMILLVVLVALLYAVIPNRQLLDFDYRDPLGGGRSKKQKENGGGKGGKDSKEESDRKEGQGGGRSEAEEMELDKPQDSKSKAEPVAIVLLRDDYDPPYGYYYFRQTAFSQYNSKRLVADTTGQNDLDLLPGYPVAPTQIPSTVPANSPYHRDLGTFTALIKGHTKPFTMVDGVSAEPAANPNPSQFVRAYESKSRVLNCDFEQMFALHAGATSWSQDTWKHYTDGPADPRYRKLAQECVARLPEQYRNSDFAKAVAVKLYLDKTVTYTTKAKHDGVDDPVADYLFVNPRGYCVHQAHAAVYLWRSLGLPARVGAGYATDARNRGNGAAILLRSAEAHAWPEIYLEGAGWVILDISPQKHEGGELDQPDPNLQRLLAELARQKDKRPPEEESRFRKLNLQELFRALLRFCWSFLRWALLTTVVGIYVYKFFRRFEPLWAGARRLPTAALRSGLDQLAEVGAVREFGEGRIVFARRLGMEALEPLTHCHLAASMGGKSPNSKEILQLRERLHQQIARRYPWWRRLLGFINPLSWWGSR